MTLSASLAALLCDLFTVGELRLWLSGREATERLPLEVDMEGPPIEVFGRVARALQDRDLVDAVFFAELARDRGGRTAEISAEAARWSSRPPRRGPVRLLHLSDLHARERTEWDARPLLVRLVDAVSELRSAGLTPDLVAITGDLAYGGQEHEYRLVEAWLREELLPAAGLGVDALLIVPGNHDVDRAACKTVVVTALDQALRTGDQDRLAEVLGQPDQRELVHRRYRGFFGSLERLGVAHPVAPSWSLVREIRGIRVRIAGLDTAWLHTSDEAQGRLAVGLAALNAALPARRDADLIVALAHHPLSWLVEQDRAAVMPPLRARADVLLRGHLHDPDYLLVEAPQHRLVELPAGASYAGHAWPMSFQLVELDPDAKLGRVSLRTWRPEWDAWVPDRTRLPPDGSWTFKLR